MKLIFKIFGVLFVLILIALISIPFFLEKNIETIVRRTATEQVKADVNFSKIGLSLIKNFPNASLTIKDLEIVNRAPFNQDTLVSAKEIIGQISFLQLFKGLDKGISIDKFYINTAKVNILTNKDGKSNYDIFETAETETPAEDTTEEASSDFKLNLNYEIENSSITYKDDVSKIIVILDDFNHKGKGDISANISDLITDTKTNFTYEMHGIKYASAMPIFLEATIGVDQGQKKYTFKDNKTLINHIPLSLSGFVQLLNDTDTNVNLDFVTKDGSFKNLLSALPNAYKKDINGVSVKGNFDLHGSIKGIVNETKIPLLDIELSTQNSSFKYPDLPKGIEDITIMAKVKNTTGNMDNTIVTVDSFRMRIDQDTFVANAKLSNLIKNPLIDFKADGTVNLENLNKAYPVELTTDLKGIITANLQTKFSMDAIENKQYNSIERQGKISLKDFMVSSPEMPHKVSINIAKINFSENKVMLEESSLTTGDSDIVATGTLDNLIPFVLSDDVLIGDFNLRSNTFKVNDFLIASEEETAEASTKTETNNTETTATDDRLIPSFLNITSTFYAKEVFYDNLNLKNTSGKLNVKDQKATLKDVNTEIFGGSIAFNGIIDAAEKKPTFDMDLDLKKLSISQSFQGFEMLKKMTPIAQALEGLYSTKISLKGILKEDLSPNLASLKGSALANLINAQMKPENNKLLNSLNQKTDFINFQKLNLKDVTANLNFEDGKIKVTPFDFKISDDFSINVGGGHSFDGGMDYNLKMNVPAKYLNGATNGLLSKLSEQEQASMNVPLPISLGGTFTDPKIGLDMKSAISSLSSQIISSQKSKVKGKVTSEVSKQINKQLNDKVSGKAKDLLGGLLESKKSTSASATDTKTTEDNTSTEDVVKEKAGKLLKGLFNKK